MGIHLYAYTISQSSVVAVPDTSFFNPFGHKGLQIYNHIAWTVSQLNRDDDPSACRLIKITVAHTIGSVWRHFDRVTSKWFLH